MEINASSSGMLDMELIFKTFKLGDYLKASWRGNWRVNKTPELCWHVTFPATTLFSRALPRFFISLLTLVLILFQQIIVYLCCLLFLSHLHTNYLRVEVLLFCSQLYPRCLEHCLAHRKNSINICYIYSRHCPHPLISSAPTPSKHTSLTSSKGSSFAIRAYCALQQMTGQKGREIALSVRSPQLIADWQSWWIKTPAFFPLSWNNWVRCMFYTNFQRPSVQLSYSFPQRHLLKNMSYIRCLLFPGSLPIPQYPLVFPRITSQINHLHSNSCVKGYSYGSPN